MSTARPLKRSRSFSPLTVDNKWKTILKKWTELTSMPDLFTKNGRKCIHFDVQLQYNTETVTVRQVYSDGINSEIYMIDFWSNGTPIQQNVILKLSTDKTMATEIEAELQMWSFLNGGNAPKVYAYNHKAIISELCTSKIKEETLSKGFKEPPKSLGKLDFNKRRWVGTYNTALGPSALHILNISKNIYKESGLYNLDPNIDNYMMIHGRDVQIDYAKERFDSEEQFEKWFVKLPGKLQTEKLRDLLIESNPPAYPPAFYWWKKFVGGASADVEIQHGWEKYQWNTYLKALEIKRNTFVKHLLTQYYEIMKSQPPHAPTKYLAKPTFLF